MKVIKPMSLSIANRPVPQPGGKVSLLVTICAGFKQSNGAVTLVSEPNFWKELSTVLPKQTAPDLCFDKPFSEWLAFGKVFPHEKEQLSGLASVEILRGTQLLSSKKLHVSGPRTWEKRLGTGWPTEPKKMLAPLLLDWSSAFGGKNHPVNPGGIGQYEESWEGQAIPQIEYYDHLITSPKDSPDPAGFGPLPLDGPSRFKSAGTYDEKWFKNDYPALASDTPAEVLMMTPKDQWVMEGFQAHDKVICKGMVAGGKELVWDIPNWQPRCMIRRSQLSPELIPIEMQLDTLCLIPHDGVLGLMWRGKVAISELDAHDVDLLFGALEDQDAPKSSTHYAEQIHNRSYGQKDAALAMIDDGPLLPRGQVGSLMAELSPESKERVSRMSAQAEKLKAQALDKKAAVLATQAQIQATDAPKTIDLQLGEVEAISAEMTEIFLSSQPNSARLIELVKRTQELALEERKKAFNNLQDLLKKNNIDSESAIKKNQQNGMGPPSRKLQKTLLILQGTLQKGLIDQEKYAELEKKVLQGVLKQNMAYRKTAHMMPQSNALIDPNLLGQQIMQYFQTEESAKTALQGVDWLGADLEGVNLCEKNLSGVFLDGANLQSAQLEGVNLLDATLTYANLAKANLRGANLENCNFGAANLQGADFTGANLKNAIFDKAHVSRANFSKAQMTACSFIGTKLFEVNFSGATLDKSKFLGIKIDAEIDSAIFDQDFEMPEQKYEPIVLTGSLFTQAKINSAIFLACTGQSINFLEAQIEKTSFIDCQFHESDFSRAHLVSVNFVMASSLQKSNFSNAVIQSCFLREIDLSFANFQEADMKKTNFSLSNMTNLNAKRANVSQARFDRTQLLGSNFEDAQMNSAFFQGAFLSQANFSRADLSLADFTKAHIDLTTIFKDVKLEYTKLKQE